MQGWEPYSEEPGTRNRRYLGRESASGWDMKAQGEAFSDVLGCILRGGHEGDP